jgi:hypothetical protein
VPFVLDSTVVESPCDGRRSTSEGEGQKRKEGVSVTMMEGGDLLSVRIHGMECPDQNTISSCTHGHMDTCDHVIMYNMISMLSLAWPGLGWSDDIIISRKARRGKERKGEDRRTHRPSVLLSFSKSSPRTFCPSVMTATTSNYGKEYNKHASRTAGGQHRRPVVQERRFDRPSRTVESIHPRTHLIRRTIQT